MKIQLIPLQQDLHRIMPMTVWFAVNEEHWIAFSPVERFTQLGTVKDNSIYYKGIRQNVDLNTLSTAMELKKK